MAERYDVVIVGAGPAGLKCAEQLAKSDLDVLIVDKKSGPYRKVCTGFWTLTERTKNYNLSDNILERKFSEIFVSNKSKRLKVGMKEPFLAMVNREELSRSMLKSLKSAGEGVEFDSNVTEIGKDFIIVNDKKVFFNNLIGADGSNSIVRKHLGLKNTIGVAIQYWIDESLDDFEVHLNSERFGPCYSWIAPHGKKTSIGTASEPSVIPTKRLKDNLDLWCKERGIDIKGAFFEAGPINVNYSGYRFDNIFLVGDAAGYASSLTGEGIFQAMLSGEEIAKMIMDNSYQSKSINEMMEFKKKHDNFYNMLRDRKLFRKITHAVLMPFLRSQTVVNKTINFLG